MDTSTLADRVYQILRKKILKGELPPGKKLNLTELAKEMNVSNTPLREAIARLEKVGLIEVSPYRCPQVKILSQSQVADIFDVRIALEDLAVRLAAKRVEPDALQRMEATIRTYEQAYGNGDMWGAIEADRAFHDELVQASGNSVLLEMLPTLSDRTRLLLEMDPPKPEVPIDRTAAQGHQRILEALREGDGDKAAKALKWQLNKGKKHLLERVSHREVKSRQHSEQHGS